MKAVYVIEKEEVKAIETKLRDVVFDPCAHLNCECFEGCENCPMQRIADKWHEDFKKAKHELLTAMEQYKER